MAKKEKKSSEKIKQARRFIERDIWRLPLRELSPKKSFLIKQLRIILIAFRGFNEDKVQLQASALTYYTLLSIIPVIAMAFGIAKGFGLEKYLEIQLQEALSGREQMYEWIINFTNSLLKSAQGGIMAGIGLFILVFAIMKVLNNIENSFNDIWQINKPRPLSRKLSDYFAMMLIAPLFLILSGSATVFITTQIEHITENFALFGFMSPVLLFLVKLIPYMLIWVMLTIIYMVMPNTNVKFSSALIAGIIAGTLFQLAQWGYIHFQVGVSRYSAIYGSFAALPLMLLWMQVSWLIILFGAEISYANQNVEHYEFGAETSNISPYSKKILSLFVLNYLIKNFYHGRLPVKSWDISHELKIPNKLVRNILNDLSLTKLITETQGTHAKELLYQPALDINKITILFALERLEKYGNNELLANPTKELTKIKETIDHFYSSIESSPKNKLLKDIT